ncbi:MAG: putative redox protein [Blastocatellia bacterium]|jgi:putative redox protein|nr:putative redox protein [Blastocatellia bacterium]
MVKLSGLRPLADTMSALQRVSTNSRVIPFGKRPCYAFPVSVELALSQMPNKDTKATIHFAGNDFFIGISPSGHAQTIETDSVRSAAATPMELLLIALGSCTGVDVISILKKKRQQVTDYRIEVSGERRAEFPKSYTRLYIKHIVHGRGVTEQALASAIELSETKYCSVAATLRGSAEIVTSYEIVEEDEVNGPV